nr:immunoglobulin heavy chain junction region [Macaca mulatta]
CVRIDGYSGFNLGGYFDYW